MALGRALLLTVTIGTVMVSVASAAPHRVPRPDLADVAKGEYDGDVISDARGSSQSGVHLSVTKIAPGTVRVSSDYSRLPSFTARLTRAMQTIQKVGGPEVFLLDLSKEPRQLDVTVDDASWSGTKN